MNHRSRLVSKAQRAIRAGADTRALKREAAAGNPYVLAFLARRGIEYDPSRGLVRKEST